MLWVVIFLCVLLLGRTAFIQFVQGSELQRKAIEQQTRDRIINSKRGTIYDRNLKPLAISASVETVTVNPSVIKENGNAESVATELSRILDMSYEEVYEKITKNSSYEYVKRKIETPQSDEIKALKAEGKLEGVNLDEDSKRYYPYNNFASHVIGFTGVDNQGLAGIELMYDKYLKGTPGRVVSAKNAVGTDMPYQYEKYYSSEDGLNVVLTLDEVIQHFVERNLETAVIENDVKNGAAAIIMDVKTGEILAMSTKPDFDLNNPLVIQDEETKAELEALSKENPDAYQEALNTALGKMWRNKAVMDTYEPGSTFKILTSAIALEENLVSDSDSFVCTGAKTIAGHSIRCWKAGGHGVQDFAKAIQNSCNPAFMTIGERIGKEGFFKYTKGFGLQEKTGIDLPGEAEGIFFNESQFGPLECATTSFGQGFQVTPIQLISAVAAVANEGKYMKPHIVKELTDSEGKVVQRFEPEFVRQIVSKETSQKMCSLLESVVSEGSGSNAYIKGYRVAGKTGTSEKQPRSEGKKIASFVGFAPADDPQVACLVMLDEPEGGQYFGGVIAAPVVGAILEDVLRYLNVEPRLSQEEVQKSDISVPEIVGDTVADATKKVTDAKFKINVVGDGDTVVTQVPKSSAQLPEGSTINAYTTEEKPTEVTVPKVTGLSVVDANTRLVNSGLNLKVSGTGRGDAIAGETVAAKQDPAEGTVVPKGSIVYVEFRHLDVE